MSNELDAAECLKRVQQFIRDEITRKLNDDGWTNEAPGAMEELADGVDELVVDILRDESDQSVRHD